MPNTSKYPHTSATAELVEDPTAYGDDDLTIVVIGFMVLSIVLALVIFFGNGMVIILVAKFEHLRTVTNYLMVSLAVADAMVSISMIFGVAYLLTPNSFQDKYICLLMWTTYMFAGLSSCLSLLAVTWERYLKISRPFAYNQIFTNRVIFAVIATIWLYTISVTVVLPFAGINTIQGGLEFDCSDFSQVFHQIYLQYLLYANAILPFGIMCFIYCKLFLVVLEKLHGHQTSYAADRTSKHWLKRELKSAKTLLILLGFTGLAWLPVSVMILCDIYLGQAWRPSVEMRSVVSMFVYVNSTANPIIYSLRSEQFRSASIKLFCGNGQCKKWSPVVSSLSVIGLRSNVKTTVI